ncbi:MAG: hypothetical protein LQ352_006065 [Teloschistes flavicans]|nr:MAG: hypothetical protein LQ352_006065 [Teloschistes flavicans]
MNQGQGPGPSQGLKDCLTIILTYLGEEEVHDYAPFHSISRWLTHLDGSMRLAMQMQARHYTPTALKNIWVGLVHDVGGNLDNVPDEHPVKKYMPTVSDRQLAAMTLQSKRPVWLAFKAYRANYPIFLNQQEMILERALKAGAEQAMDGAPACMHNVRRLLR